MPYFNYQVHEVHVAAAGYSALRQFIQAWWAIYRDDDRWTPPEYGQFRRELNPRRNEHLARLDATLIHLDAMHRTGVSRSRTDQQEIPLTSVFERPMAAAVGVIDPRRRGKTAHLALPHLRPDREAWDRLYYHLVETLSAKNYHRVVGPVGLSPHLGSGLLVDSWDEWPPLHTPANPPYAPELVERRLQTLQTGRLYHAAVPPNPWPLSPGRAAIRAFEPGRLATDLRPLLVAATDNPAAGFPPPDEAEAAYILRLLRPKTLTGFLAEVDYAPVGFVLLGPDTAGRLRAVRGGRPLWGRALLHLETRFFGKNRVSRGRIYYGAVLPEWRGQGIGRRLWQRTLGEAAARGWESLSVGPVWLDANGASPAAAFLEKQGAVARQTYKLYEWSF
jgi:GNAT superfamily N-acetyltransferase